MEERAWAAFRKRVRTKANSQGTLIIGPLIVVLAVIKILEPMDYQVGDFRNSIEFRLIFYGLFVALAVVGMIVSARWLLADRRA